MACLTRADLQSSKRCIFSLWLILTILGLAMLGMAAGGFIGRHNSDYHQSVQTTMSNITHHQVVSAGKIFYSACYNQLTITDNLNCRTRFCTPWERRENSIKSILEDIPQRDYWLITSTPGDGNSVQIPSGVNITVIDSNWDQYENPANCWLLKRMVYNSLINNGLVLGSLFAVLSIGLGLFYLINHYSLLIQERRQTPDEQPKV